MTRPSYSPNDNVSEVMEYHFMLFSISRHDISTGNDLLYGSERESIIFHIYFNG